MLLHLCNRHAHLPAYYAARTCLYIIDNSLKRRENSRLNLTNRPTRVPVIRVPIQISSVWDVYIIFRVYQYYY